jgi:SAM-dependent methyltransferase
MMLPLEFNYSFYREKYPDIRKFDDSELLMHYALYGMHEGRVCNEVLSRSEFALLIPQEDSALEIGPFATPMLKGENVLYCDVLDQNELIKRAKSLNIPTDNIPHIHFILGKQFLDGIEKKFKAILSSHVIEHQPNLIEHFQQIERKLEEDGRYFLLIPDKRYCFDKNFAPSDISEVLEANYEKRKRHTLANIVRHRALISHNNPVDHWDYKEVNQNKKEISANTIENAVNEYQLSDGDYIDVHGWFFTPDSFVEIVQLTNQMGFHSLNVERLYRTRKNELEFWVILKNGNYEASIEEQIVRRGRSLTEA